MADGLTKLQKRFIEEYTRNGFRNAKGAALKAGYSDNTADEAWRAVLGSDTVREEIEKIKEEIRQRLRDCLVSEAEKSVEILVKIRDSKKSPAGVRVAAAKDILDRAEVTGVTPIAGGLVLKVVYEEASGVQDA